MLNKNNLWKRKYLAKRKEIQREFYKKLKKNKNQYRRNKFFVEVLKQNQKEFYKKLKEKENKRRESMGLPKKDNKNGRNGSKSLVREKEMKYYLGQIFPNQTYKDNKKYYWLNNLELDRFYPKLKLAFEYQGILHFKRINFFNNNVRKIKERDNLKKELCKGKDITLIEITCFEKLSKELIINKLKENNFELKKNNFRLRIEK